MSRQNISSGAPWEAKAGYSRVVAAGNSAWIAGTTAVKDGHILHPDDPYKQTLAIFEIIESSLKKAGFDLSDIVRTRMYVKNIDDWEEVTRAHKEKLGDVLPAATLVEISNLIGPHLLVEIEAEAYKS